jgi:cytochrome c1
VRARAFHRAAVVAFATLVVAVAGCTESKQLPERVVPGSPDRGKELIAKYGCGSCHTIPGIKGASALVGPPLIHFGRRSFVGGQLANTPENLARWVQDPQAVEPGTDMPNLGIAPDEARDIAAYLENLQ